MSVFNNIPFLRITLAFAAGIIISATFNVPIQLLYYTGCVLFISLIALSIKYSYRISRFWGSVVFIFLINIGSITHSLYNTKNDFAKSGTMAATILETPQEKQNSYKSLVLLHTNQTNDTITIHKEKLIVYFEKSEAAMNLIPGNQIIFNAVPETIKNRGNPNEFDYKKYLNNKRIYRQAYLRATNWQTSPGSIKTPVIWAELIREELLKTYRKQHLGKKETEILSALTLGYKRNLDLETKRVFSAAGAMHVLAVSGLHVGIIYLIISFFLGFLKKQKAGRFLFPAISISALWLYAFITGFSPSVMRASSMFSLVIIANSTNCKANIYNSLAASAFILLLINPNNLFETGFQLSYSAVFGIVFLQPRIAKLWQVKNKILKFLWDLFTVSLAAQISTFPLTAFYFNLFPTYFLLSNFIVIPAAMLLIPLGLCLLVFSKIAVLGTLLSIVTKGIISVVYGMLAQIESFPFSTLEIALSAYGLTLVVIVSLSIFVFLEFKKANAIKAALAALLCLFISFAAHNYKQSRNNEIIVLNTKETAVCLIAGRNIYAITNDTLTPDDYLFRSFQSIKRQKGLKKIISITGLQNYRDKYLCINNGIIVFNGKTICLANYHKQIKFSPSIIIAEKNLKRETQNIRNNSLWIQRYNTQSPQDLENFHILSKQGAFSIKF